METGILRCASCGRGHHQWSPQTYEDIGPQGHSIRLYRWDCVCQGCATPCETQRVQMHPHPSPEDETSVTALRAPGAASPLGPSRRRGDNLPWPSSPPARQRGDEDIVTIGPQPEFDYVDSALMARILRGLHNL